MKSSSNKKSDKQISDRVFTLYVYLPFVKKTYTLKKIARSSIIHDIQTRIELVCGIPRSIQRLHYLDEGELSLGSTLSSLDIVNKAAFTLHIWQRWEKFVLCIYENNVREFREHVLSWLDHGNTNSKTKFTTKENENKASISAYLASHLGMVEILKTLLDFNISLNSSTELGNTPLLAAIANGKYKCIDFLLENGASYNKNSEQSQTASLIANQNGFTESDRHVFMFNWRSRAKQKLTQEASHNTPLLMHQQFDSNCPTWFSGPYSTKYIVSTLPHSKFSGTSLSAPLKKTRERNDVFYPRSIKDDGLPSISTSPSLIKEKSSGPHFHTWLETKKQQKRYEMQKMKNEEIIKKQKEQESEKERRYSQRKVEHERRVRQARDDVDKFIKKTNIYEDFTHMPNYGRSLINQLIHELPS